MSLSFFFSRRNTGALIPNITVSAAVISLGERLAMGACRSGLQMWKASAACSGTEDTDKRHPAQATQPTESNTVRHCPWDGTIAMVNVTSLCTTQPSAHAAAVAEVGGPLGGRPGTEILAAYRAAPQ